MEKHPDHKASFEYPEKVYRVKVGEKVIVDTSNAIQITESTHKGSYPPVLYFPVKDTNMEFLQSSDLHTSCPLKGEASYYNLVVEGEVYENAVWYYPEPFDDVKELKGFLSFYPDKVAIESSG